MKPGIPVDIPSRAWISVPGKHAGSAGIFEYLAMSVLELEE
jgi:hypothetical protein